MTKKFSELTDSQWDAISPFFDNRRKRKLCLRDVFNGIMYILRTGCQWRNLPQQFPNWRAVNYYFERWKKDGTFERMNACLNQLDRLKEKKAAYPSLMCVDSQSVKLAPMIFENRGIDSNKRVNGRKRQLLVDSGGRLWRALVCGANHHDGPSACPLLDNTELLGGFLKTILGDEAYRGVFARKANEKGLHFERASRPESAKGFVPIAKRWVVERTIAWTNFFRRIVKDYEISIDSSVAWLLLANSTIMIQRIRDETI
jgi:transposase